MAATSGSPLITVDPGLLAEADSAGWQIPWDRIRLGRELGAGAYGVVFEGEYAGLTIAAKKLRGEIAPDNVKEEFEREVSTLKALRHPNVILFMGVTQDPEGNWYILSEFGAKGSLNYLLSKTPHSWTQKITFVKEICLALAYLHENGCLHRDLKAENVLVSHADVCKVADFGLARIQFKSEPTRESMTATQGIGTLWWRAPEVDDPTATYSEKIDVFSLGITIAEIITDGRSGDELRLEGTQPDPKDKFKWLYSSALLVPLLDQHHPPAALIDMVVRCGLTDPTARPTVSEVVLVAKRLQATIERAEKRLQLEVPSFEQIGMQLINPHLTWENPDAAAIERSEVYRLLSTRLQEKTTVAFNSDAIEFLNVESTIKTHQFTIDSLIDFLAWYSALEALLLNPLILPLFKTGFVHAFVSRTRAEAMVKAGPVGCFCARFSSKLGHLALTYRKTPEDISHLLYRINPDVVLTSNSAFPNLGAAIKSNPALLFVCPDRPLSHWDDIHAQISTPSVDYLPEITGGDELLSHIPSLYQ